MNPRDTSIETVTRTGASRPADVSGMCAGIAKGDEASFNRFYGDYFDKIHRYLLIIANGREDVVNDAMQDTMIRVIRYMKPFDDEPSFWNWLRRIAKSAFIDQLRTRKQMNPEASLPSMRAVEADERGTDPSEELKGHLSSSLAMLDAKDRGLVEGKYLEERSYEELARNRGITPKAVESRLGRIRKQLKALIMERMKNE